MAAGGTTDCRIVQRADRVGERRHGEDAQAATIAASPALDAGSKMPRRPYGAPRRRSAARLASAWIDPSSDSSPSSTRSGMCRRSTTP